MFMGVELELQLKSCKCHLISGSAWLHETKCRPCVCRRDVQYVVFNFCFSSDMHTQSELVLSLNIQDHLICSYVCLSLKVNLGIF